ncbi:MAG: tRNA (adenosine(37)-N6)-dimethylallyltransferase MiaA [Pseudobdellovibrionaceae bacterium]
MKVVFVMGPTGSGKSSLAHRLANRFPGAILNCDSVQCYSRVDIGSAKPSVQEMREVPHSLYSFVSPPEKLTAGEYRNKALEALRESAVKVPVVFVVGGTGFYFQALEKGMLDVPAADPEIRSHLESELAAKGSGEMWEKLKSVDPATAVQVKPQDSYRILRALEVFESTGVGLAEWKEKQAFKGEPFPYPLLKLGTSISRDELRERLRKRLAQMFQAGFVEEVRELLKEGLSEWAPLESVGYQEIKQKLQSGGDLKSLPEEILTSHMQLAKKQKTWFQRDPKINWLAMEDPDKAFSEAQLKVDDFLRNGDVG